MLSSKQLRTYLRQIERELVELQGECTPDKCQRKHPLPNEPEGGVLLSLCKVACTALENMQTLLTSVDEPRPQRPAIDIAPNGVPQERWDTYSLDQKQKVLALRKMMGVT